MLTQKVKKRQKYVMFQVFFVKSLQEVSKNAYLGGLQFVRGF